MADIAADGMEFKAGRVIARSFSIMFRNIVPFGLLALILTSPSYIFLMLTEAGILDGSSMFVIFIVDTLAGYLVTAALVFGAIQSLRKIRVGVGECFSQGLARMFPVLGVAIVSAIIFLIAFLPVMFGWLVPLAIPVLIVPGLYIMVLLWVVVPVAVIERRGIDSLARSTELTAGYRWRVFFVLVLMVVALIGPVAFFRAMEVAMSVGGEGSVGYLTTEWISSAAASMFMAVVYAVSYHDLRAAKEGVDSERIAAVFD